MIFYCVRKCLCIIHWRKTNTLSEYFENTLGICHIYWCQFPSRSSLVLIYESLFLKMGRKNSKLLNLVCWDETNRWKMQLVIGSLIMGKKMCIWIWKQMISQWSLQRSVGKNTLWGTGQEARSPSFFTSINAPAQHWFH